MTKPRQNSSIWSCVRRRRNGKCRRVNGARRKPSSPSCSKTGSSWHDGQPAPHTRFLIVPQTVTDSPLTHSCRQSDRWLIFLHTHSPSKRLCRSPATALNLSTNRFWLRRINSTVVGDHKLERSKREQTQSSDTE